MATNGVNMSEDAEMADCDGDKVVTMMDVLQEQQDFEEDANAVLGASDDKNCTYSKGYVKRQAIYACLTCCPEAVTDSMKRAGVCLACSLACHENHELVELYTKRNFRCDCGNPKFSQPCQFTPNKTDLNYENKYNQNFSGVYCNCKRPYPDPEATEEEEMIQCIICEDWLHTNHLEATVPSNDLYAEMICKACMEDIDFLHDYSDLVVNVEDKEIIVMDPDLDVTSIIKSKESPTKELPNGAAEEETNKESVSDTTDTNLDENKQDETTDVEMNENKPDESGDRNDATKEETKNAEQSEKTVTEASGDANPDTATNEAKEGPETGNKEEKKEDSVNSEAAKESDENTNEQSAAVENNSNDNTTATNKAKEDNETGNNEEKKDNNVNSEARKESNEQSAAAENNSNDKTTATNEAKEDTETGNNEEKKEDNVNSEAAKESGENTNEQSAAVENNSNDKTTGVEENSKDQTLEAEKTDYTGNNTDASESTDKKIENNLSSESDIKDEMVTTTTDVSSSEKPQENDLKEDSTADKENESPTHKQDHKRKLSEGDIDVSPKKQKLETKPCVRPRGVKRVYKGATFWPTNLRQKLCTCSECLSMYKDLAVLFLIDPEDTVTAYEALGKENINGASSSQYEKGLQALSSLDRVQQINALTEYNKMRDKLLDFLKTFKDKKEIVKEEDIRAFFAGMKPKREPDGVYFCR